MPAGATPPVLERLRARAAEEWRRQVRLLCERLPGVGERGIERVELLGNPRALPASAMAITFASGRTLVYKPRDQRPAAWFVDLCRELNDRGLDPPLHERNVVAHPDHGWDELVRAAPCGDPDAVARFFVRAGALLRLLTLLRAADMHRHNVIYAGEHPVIVDLDGLFRPVEARPRPLAQTPYATGFLPIWVPQGSGVPPVNGGGLHDDGALRPAEHEAEILRGHDAMQALLERVDLAPLLRRAAELPVRDFPRPVTASRTLLARSVAPELLASEEAREAFLATVTGPRADEERAALRDGFLPELTMRADVRVTTREDPAWRDVIRAALAVAGPAQEAPRAPSTPRVRPWLEAAREVADVMLASGLAAGVVWMPAAGVRRLAGLPPDVLSGHAGIALVFSRLFAVTRDVRHRDAARRALGPVLRAVAAPAQAQGLHVGRGGQLHALRVGARLLEDPALEAPPVADLGPVPAAATPLEAALDAGLHDDAVALAAEAFGRHDATGSWSPEPRIPDRFNPCAVTGLGSLALAFLRLARGGGGLFADL